MDEQIAEAINQGRGRPKEIKGELQRVTLRMRKDRLEEIQGLVDKNEYPNRSEVIRVAVADLLDAE
jgi:metal-responsive CopG/Arc/MetJ family transcriptional regulator